MTRRRNFVLAIFAALMLAGTGLAAAGVYAASQLRTLGEQAVYASPEEGMRALVARHYSGVEKVEIVGAGKEIFDDLRFVVAHVWAAGRADGDGFSGRGYDNPGWFFLRVERGWVFVPEGNYPWVIALGKKLLDFRG